MIQKNSELRYIASDWQSDKNASNLVNKFYVIDQYLTRTIFSTSNLLFIIVSILYKAINKLYDERNLIHPSMNQKIKEAQMTATAAQLDAVTTLHVEISVSVHKINAITAKHKHQMKDSCAIM